MHSSPTVNSFCYVKWGRFSKNMSIVSPLRIYFQQKATMTNFSPLHPYSSTCSLSSGGWIDRFNLLLNLSFYVSFARVDRKYRRLILVTSLYPFLNDDDDDDDDSFTFSPLLLHPTLKHWLLLCKLHLLLFSPCSEKYEEEYPSDNSFWTSLLIHLIRTRMRTMTSFQSFTTFHIPDFYTVATLMLSNLHLLLFFLCSATFGEYSSHHSFRSPLWIHFKMATARPWTSLHLLHLYWSAQLSSLRHCAICTSFSYFLYQLEECLIHSGHLSESIIILLYVVMHSAPHVISVCSGVLHGIISHDISFLSPPWILFISSFSHIWWQRWRRR